jgi:hypothetical protein
MATNEGLSDVAGFVDTRPARRLANNIESLKSLLLILTALATIGGMIGVGGDAPGLAIIFAIYGVISGVSIYVFFGWLENTLRLLTGIAYNTAFSAGVMAGPKD